MPVAAIPEIEELNIGHSIVSRAVMTGMRARCEEMAPLGEGRQGLIPYLRHDQSPRHRGFLRARGRRVPRPAGAARRPATTRLPRRTSCARRACCGAPRSWPASSRSRAPPAGSSRSPGRCAKAGARGIPAAREQVAQAVEEFRLPGAPGARVGRRRHGACRRGSRSRSIRWPAGRRPSRASAAASAASSTPACAPSSAREGALIASALDRAARALQAAPGDREPLYTVIRRMQSLRGLAELSELAPLPEILDGIELAVGDLTRLFAPPPGVDEVMAAAAIALTRISRDIAEHGRPEPETRRRRRRFTELLLRAFAVERDVVPIESLYYADDPAPLTPPARASRSSRPPRRSDRSSW